MLDGKIEFSYRTEKVIKALRILGFVKLVIYLASLMFMVLGAIAERHLGTSIFGVLGGITLLFGVLSVAFVFVVARQLAQRKTWAYFGAIVVACFALMSLLFPFSIYIGWYLLPESVAMEIKEFWKSSVKPAFHSEMKPVGLTPTAVGDAKTDRQPEGTTTTV